MSKRQTTAFIPMRDVNIKDAFWGQYVDLVKNVVIPYQWEAINDRVEGADKSHAVQNFKIAAGLAEGEFYGFIFQDTDVAKWLEAVGYVLLKSPNEKLEAIADEMIDIIEKAQHPDGYLNTYYTIKEPNNRFTNLTEAHELYTAGHMIEAAVSYYQATGKKKLLHIACRLADCIDQVFGYGDNQIQGFDGHQEIELALVKLYQVTGEARYLNLSKFFIDIRGTNNFMHEEAEKRGWTSIWHKGRIGIDPPYFQAHKPVREQTEAIGHAVRVVYMLTAMIDIARETNDETLIEASYTLWNNIVNKQMYITGGIGSTVHGEAFTFNYDLPNDTAYAETCASIGLIFAGKRMLELDTNSQYGDAMERALYNTVLSGMSLDGQHFFYVNPLEVFPEQCHGRNKNFNHVKPTRPKWYGCACCPPNLARLLASLGDYLYSVKERTIFSHLFVGSEATLTIEGKEITVSQHSQLPWEGKVSYAIKNSPIVPITLAIRQPGWSKHAKIMINGELYNDAEYKEDGFLYINRLWLNDDVLEIEFDLSVKRMQAHPSIRHNAGKIALQRGPLVYCIEEADNGKQLQFVALPDDAQFTLSRNTDLAGGVVTIEAAGLALTHDESNHSELYSERSEPKLEARNLTFIPYFSWANRGEGEMMVWVKEKL